jgi:hypothetical protein
MRPYLEKNSSQKKYCWCSGSRVAPSSSPYTTKKKKKAEDQGKGNV